MQKVYLLLRNNQQSGPYSLEELIQLGLKPHDLIWVDGRSAAWVYPSEIELLRPYAPSTPPQTIAPVKSTATDPSPSIDHQTKTVFVSLPQPVRGASVPSFSAPEEKQQKAAAPIGEAEPLQTHYARSLHEVEDEYTKWMVNSKTKKRGFQWKSQHTVLAGSIALLGLGLLAGKALFADGAPVANKIPVAQQAASPADQPEQETTATTTEVVQAGEPTVSLPPSTNNVKQENAKKPAQKAAVKPKASEPSAVAGKPATTAAEPSVTSPQVTEEAPASTKEETATAETKKKKSLKEVLGSIFKKKESAPTPSGDRTATKRETEAPTDISGDVSLKISTPSSDWMMGVQGLKCTLQNKSSSTLLTADAEVLYYSEQNSVIERKTIRFTNIAPGRSHTLPLPDHRLADHAEVKLLRATGASADYARQ